MYFNHSLRLCLGTRAVSQGVYTSDRLVRVSQPPPVRRPPERWHPHRCLGQLAPRQEMTSGLWQRLGSDPVQKLPLTPAPQVSAGVISPPCSLRMAEWCLPYLGVVSRPLAISALCVAQARDLLKGGNRLLSNSCKEISFIAGGPP